MVPSGRDRGNDLKCWASQPQEGIQIYLLRIALQAPMPTEEACWQAEGQVKVDPGYLHIQPHGLQGKPPMSGATAPPSFLARSPTGPQSGFLRLGVSLSRKSPVYGLVNTPARPILPPLPLLP